MTTCLEICVIYFLSYFRMGILDEEDDSSKPTPSIIVVEAQDKNSRHVRNVTAPVPLISSPHPPQKYPPEAASRPIQHQRHPYRQYSFNASNFVWSTGLYSTLPEDLNLSEWKYFENCKRIWECAAEQSRGQKKRSKGQRISNGLGKIKQKVSRRRQSGSKNGKPKPSKKKDRGTSPHNFVLSPPRGPPPPSQVLPSPYQMFQEDLSMSLELEPISSSSFHSSSDCDEEL